MKKLMMLMVMGLALATTGFAQERGGSRFGGGHFSYNARGASGQFSGQTARGGRYVGGFSGNRRGYGGTSLGFGFSYAPAPYVSSYCPDPYYACTPAYCPPAYYNPGPVVGVGVVRGGYARGRAFVGRGGDGHGFHRR